MALRFWLLVCVCLMAGQAYAQGTQGMAAKNALLKLYMEEINLTEHERLGWLGSSYLLEAFPGVFVGGSLYGAVTGRRGGFFSLGSEVLWRKRLGKHGYVDMGMYVGGGGGGAANALVQGGLMIRPHIDLSYAFSAYQLGLSMSHVRFPYGTISSNQIGISVSHPHSFYHIGDADAASVSDMDGGLGVHRIRGVTALYQGNLFGKSHHDAAVMLGARADYLMNEQYFWSLEVVGAAGGKLGGYAEYLLGLGASYPVFENVLRLGYRMGMGMGGGGGAATQGGLLAKASLFGEVRLASDVCLALEGGYMGALQGKMKVRYADAALVVDLDQPYAASYHTTLSDYEWQAGVFHYHTVIPRGQTTSVPMTASEIVVNRFPDEHWYHGVHMMYAARGGRYGGYGAAFVSLGYKKSWFGDVAVSLEFAAGGGGGGATSVGGGALYMVNTYMDYALTPSVGLRLGAGRLKAIEGALDTLTSTMMLTYTYSVEERRANRMDH